MYYTCISAMASVISKTNMIERLKHRPVGICSQVLHPACSNFTVQVEPIRRCVRVQLRRANEILSIAICAQSFFTEDPTMLRHLPVVDIYMYMHMYRCFSTINSHWSMNYVHNRNIIWYYVLEVRKVLHLPESMFCSWSSIFPLPVMKAACW